MNRRTLTSLLLLTACVPALGNAEVLTGRLLSSQLSVYEQQQRSVLNAVLKLQDGSYVLINCDLRNEPEPAVDLREANALMQAYIAGGSRTRVEAEVEKSSSASGFPTYAMKTWKMPIPGFDAYRFTCGQHRS